MNHCITAVKVGNICNEDYINFQVLFPFKQREWFLLINTFLSTILPVKRQ